jgi:hypothetical protein
VPGAVLGPWILGNSIRVSHGGNYLESHFLISSHWTVQLNCRWYFCMAGNSHLEGNPFWMGDICHPERLPLSAWTISVSQEDYLSLDTQYWSARVAMYLALDGWYWSSREVNFPWMINVGHWGRQSLWMVDVGNPEGWPLVMTNISQPGRGTATKNPSGGLVQHGIGHNCPMLCWKSLSDRFVWHRIGQFCLIPCQTNLFQWVCPTWDRTIVSDPLLNNCVQWVCPTLSASLMPRASTF